jgi:hypothetical protein
MKTRAAALCLLIATSLTAAACSGSAVVIDDDLEPLLVGAPDAGGPWTLQDERGNPIDLLDPVCGVVLPEPRPFSIGHNGRVWFGGEPYPVLLHIVDRFESQAEAATLVALHRDAAEGCTSWTFEDERGAVRFTVDPTDAGAPAGAVSLEIAAESGTETLMTRQVMFASGDVVEFLAHISLGEPDPGVLDEMVAEAAAR